MAGGGGDRPEPAGADPSELFTIPEAAKLLKVSMVYVRREIKARRESR
jgi:hypothetical protein